MRSLTHLDANPRRSAPHAAARASMMEGRTGEKGLTHPGWQLAARSLYVTTATLEQLSGYLGATAAEALHDWATLNGRDLHVPAHPWLRRGFTDAQLAQLFIADPEHGTRLVVIKVLPGKSAEPQAHRRALLETPPAFRPHLVEQVYEPLPIAGGGAIAFQRLAGDSRDWRPMADLPSQRLGSACEVIIRALLADWNPDHTIRTARTVDFLRAEVENQGSVHSHVAPAGASAQSAWIRIDGDHPLPNPIHLLGDESLLADEPIDLVYGRSHGDLHDLNVLIRQSRDALRLDSFVFVDLMDLRVVGPARPRPAPAAAVGDRPRTARPLRPATGAAAARLRPAPRTGAARAAPGRAGHPASGLPHRRAAAQPARR
jgi:hypothetical protein